MIADEVYKSAKLSVNGDATHNRQVTVQEEDEPSIAGPELPPAEEDGEDSNDDEEGRFFGGGITRDAAAIMDFIDERDKDDMAVSVYVESLPKNGLIQLYSRRR